MSANSIYEVPETLQRYILHEKGIAEYPATEAQIRERAEVLDHLRSQWQSIVDNATFGQINDLIGVKLGRNGRLYPTWQADHTYSGGTLVAVPYRFITLDLARKYVQEYVGWLDVDGDVDAAGRIQTLYVYPKSDTSQLRRRGFEEATRSAHEQLGSLIQSANHRTHGSAMKVVNREVYIDDHGYLRGFQLNQLYWVLAVAKEIRDNLTNLMRDALRMQRGQAVVEVEKRDTSGSFDAFMAKRLDSLRAEGPKPSIQNLPVIDPADEPTPRTWGIEIEAAGARNIEAPSEDWQRKGDGSLRSAYGGNHIDRVPEDCPDHDHENFTGTCEWLTERLQDTAAGDADYFGTSSRGDTAEFVSPILSTAGDMNLKALLDDLIREPQNDTAGVHVHVDASDLTPKNVGALVFAYSTIEPIIEAAYRRNVRNYCRERSSEDVLEVVRSSKKPGIKKAYRGSSGDGPTMHHGDRYHSVNLNALEAHGTIEFRAMGPVYKYDHLIKWALFVREMVSISKLDLPPRIWTSIKNWKDLEKVLYKYGTELPANRIREMEVEFADTREKVNA